MPAKRPVYAFDTAIVRLPSPSVTDGLRATDRGDPTYAGVKAEHQAYRSALEAAGVVVQCLDPLDDYPDSIFVEDPALVFTEGAVLLRPGVASRRGETAAIAPVLRQRFGKVVELPRGFADGGDVLTLPDKIMIGLSARTDRDGAESLATCLAELGRKAVIVETPPDVLHFKSDCALLDDATIVTTARLAASGVFAGFRLLVVPAGEEAAANALRVNDVVFVGSDHAGTIALLREHGFDVVPLKTSEIAKIDAGLSCMSLRWHG